ncbi:MAG TPA: PEP-CTERM sorting domain-containing protein [Gemmataceae bacterium]|jgi:hypothetical protein|nr:PEP-CTERM sorting domain-containing protein [Gemmataceae bacterium]
MKKLILCMALLGFLPAHIWAGVMLGTTPDQLFVNSNASSTTLSGTMDVMVTSNASDMMAAWTVQLQITPLAGATGTLMFQTATQGPSPYIFGTNGFGVSATITNSGSQLAANDFDGLDGVNFSATVPATPTNLLAITYLASAGASGKFGIFAVPGGPVNSVTNPALTYWNDGANNQSFNSVTPGSNLQIGEVDLTLASVPEPSTLTLLGIGIAGIAAWGWRRNKVSAAFSAIKSLPRALVCVFLA